MCEARSSLCMWHPCPEQGRTAATRCDCATAGRGVSRYYCTWIEARQLCAVSPQWEASEALICAFDYWFLRRRGRGPKPESRMRIAKNPIRIDFLLPKTRKRTKPKPFWLLVVGLYGFIIVSVLHPPDRFASGLLSQSLKQVIAEL